jgi:hypothetical protein
MVIVLAALAMPQWTHTVPIVVLLCALGAVGYSYLEWKREQSPASPAS